MWAGPNLTYVLKTDGTLWVSGVSEINPFSPSLTQVGADNDWKELSHFANYTLAIKEDGSLWSWGTGYSGVLGQGSYSGTLTIPTRIGISNEWIDVTAGASHALAIKAEGTLWGWGNNDYGQLGNGTLISASAPVQIGTLNGWKSVSAGSAHSIAIRTTGSLWAWGFNGNGQLGDTSTITRKAPVQIGTSGQWNSIRAGSFHSLALAEDGTLYAWGRNTAGQLGVGDMVQRNVPTPLSGGGTWLAFDAGISHSVALKSDGTLAAWGSNTYGQLGSTSLTATTPQPADFNPRADISLSITANPVYDGHLVNDGSATLAFPLTAEQSPTSVPINIFNHGTAVLLISAVTIPAGFSITPQPPFAIAPGASREIIATLNTTIVGNLSGSLAVFSNDADEAVFDVAVSGSVLSLTKDTDGDGLNDAAELNYSSLGFNWNSSQPTLVSALLAGAPRAGFLTEAQLFAASPGTTVIRKNPANSTASLLLSFERSLNLSGFFRSNLGMTNITSDGSVEIPLTAGSASEFFRFGVEPMPLAEP